MKLSDETYSIILDALDDYKKWFEEDDKERVKQIEIAKKEIIKQIKQND